MEGEIEFSIGIGARATLSGLHAKIKELRAKRDKIKEEIERTKTEIGNFSSSEKARLPSQSKKPPKKKWFSEYLCFTTSWGSLVAAGRNAKQNDELAAKHLAESDLFFHADIQGAPTTILKDGKKLLEQAKNGDETAKSSLNQTAQWAASYSSAWKTGVAAVDVYALFSHQVSKHAPGGGSVGKGAFALSGEREWFRTTPLGIKIGFSSGELSVLPICHPAKLEKEIALTPGKTEKEQAAKVLSSRLSCKAEDILHCLPSGKFGI